PVRTRCEVPADNLASYVRAADDPRHPACDGLCIKGECLPFAPAGASCASSSGCVPGLHCVAGVCQDRELPKAGEACGGRTSCGAGAFCQDGRCRPQKAAGEACTLSSECRALACVKAQGATVGKCAEPCGPSHGSPRFHPRMRRRRGAVAVGTLRFTSLLAPVAEAFCAEVVGYLGRRLGSEVRVALVDDIPWRDRLRRFARGRIHVAWMCGLPYTRLARRTPP